MKHLLLNTTSAIALAFTPVAMAAGISTLGAAAGYARTVDSAVLEKARNQQAQARANRKSGHIGQLAQAEAPKPLLQPEGQQTGGQQPAQTQAQQPEAQQPGQPQTDNATVGNAPKATMENVEETRKPRRKRPRDGGGNGQGISNGGLPLQRATPEQLDQLREMVSPPKAIEEAPRQPEVADEPRRKKRRDRDRARRDNSNGGLPLQRATPEQQDQLRDMIKRRKPSEQAPRPRDLAVQPLPEQLRKAEETPAIVVPDNINDDQRRRLRNAEKKRREKARRNRQDLLGAVAVGAIVGALIPQLGGRVVEDQGDRVVVERDGRYYVRKDESALFRDDAEDIEIESLPNGRTLETVYRRNGSRIETVRDAGGYVLRRVKIDRHGREHVLFDSRDIDDRRHRNYDRDLPPIRLNIPRDEYIVSGGRSDRRSLAEIFAAPPVEEVTEQYSLRDVRESNRVRSIVRSVDLDTITFDSGSATVRASEVEYLADIAGSMLDTIEADEETVFLIEGHTDSVGSDLSNITLSDRRAETVARILVEAFNVPPENLVTQGYGEQYLKINVEGDIRENRRVTIRNISPLLQTAAR